MKSRNIIFLVLLFFFHFTFSQTQDELNKNLEDLNLQINELDEQISLLQKQKLSLLEEASGLKQKLNKLDFEKESSEGFSVTIAHSGGKLRDEPSITGNTIAILEAGETINVYNWYQKPYFKASYKEMVGFISYASLEKNDEIEQIVGNQLKEENPKLARLTKKYGSHAAEKIIQGQYWIGMTDSMARDALGSPNDINKSTGSWGVHEQWVYDKKKMYLYFENGKLTSYQNY